MTEHTLDRDPRDDLDEELFGDRAGRRIGRSTVILLAGVLAVAAFVGGALAQKHWGTTTSAAAAPAAGVFGGFPAGGFGQGVGAGAGAQAGRGTGQAGGQAAATGPAVVGTVVAVSGRTLTVKNFAGKTVKVTVPEAAAITSATELARLAAGQSVAVSGTAAADGSVTATSVTARAAS